MPVSTGAAIVASLLPAALFFTLNYLAPSTTPTFNDTLLITNYSTTPPPGIPVNLPPVSSSPVTTSEPVTSSSTVTREPPTDPVTSPPSSEPLTAFLLDLGIDIKKSSVVKKSVEVPQVFPKLPTCCDISLNGNTLSSCDSPGDKPPSDLSVWEVPLQLMYRKQTKVKFRLEKQRPMCMSGVITATLDDSGDAEGVSGNHFLPDGRLKLHNEYYSPNQFCLNGEQKGKLEVFACKVNCWETPCVQKCCSHDEIYSLGMNGKRGGCLPVNSNGQKDPLWSPTFYDTLNKKTSPQEARLLKPHLIHKTPTSFKPLCPNGVTTVFPYGQSVSGFLSSALKRPMPHLKFQLRKDGWLVHPNSSSESPIGILKKSRTTLYCIDGVQNYGESESFANLEDQTVLFACTSPSSEEPVASGAPKLTSRANVIRSQRVPTSSTAGTPTTSTTPPTTSTTTTTTTPKPVVIPTLPTCCHLDPSAKPGSKLSHYCLNTPHNLSHSPSTTEWIAAPKFMRTNKTHKFNLIAHPLGCKDNWTKAFILNYDNLPGGGSPSLMPNGMLRFQNEFFKPGEFCVNGIFSSIVEVLMCNTDCSSPLTPCINKCCGPNEIYSLGSGGKRRGCIPLKPGDEPWIPSLYDDMSQPLRPHQMTSLRPHLLQKFPPKFQYSCYKNITLVFPFKKEVVPLMSPLAKSSLQFRLRKDGKIMYRHPLLKDSKGQFMESVFNNVEYCVDGIRNYGEPNADAPYKSKDDNSVLFVCAMIPPESTTPPL